MMGTDELPLVSIQCLVYNHEPYLRQCLDGFVMQKTNFKLEAIVHDDVSTDGSVAIIREYAEKYPDIIKPIFETENQYSKHDGSLERIMHDACKGKYIALCEGDDYWIDPMKLQKQVDFMEGNLEHSLCITAYKEEWGDIKFVNKHRYTSNVLISPMRDILLENGAFFSTATMLFRASMYERPFWWNNLPIGDIPTLIVLAHNGHVGYINEETTVYRRFVPGSWSTTSKKNIQSIKNLHLSLIRMWWGYNKWTKNKYLPYLLYNIVKEYFELCKRILLIILKALTPDLLLRFRKYIIGLLK